MIKKNLQLAIVLLLGIFITFASGHVHANQDQAIPLGCPGSNFQGPIQVDSFGDPDLPYDCDDPSTWPDAAPAYFVERPDIEAQCDSDNLSPQNCGIVAYLKIFTDALIVIFGVVVVMMIVIGGIQYSAAGSNPQSVAAAKKRITQAIFALVAYIFLFAFLQWLIPGGVF